jgi:multidrug efflux system membrane fusion protein
MSQTQQTHAQKTHAPSKLRPRRTWRTLAGVVLVVVVAAVIGSLLARCAANGSERAGPFGRGMRPNITVGVATATRGDIPITVSALGTVTPEVTVSVISRVTGQVEAAPFKEGQAVRKGELLAQIDPAPFQAAVKQAEGTVDHDKANLAGAQVDLDRYKTLIAQNSIARQTYEDQESTVRQVAAQVLADQGALDTAKLNLQWTRIISPVSGRVGIRQLDPGNQVAADSSTPIAIVTQLDPIDVIFAIPEDSIPAILRHPDYGAGLPVTAYGRSGGAPLAAGELATIDNVVDTTTGTVKGKARFANANGLLFPNQFVSVNVLVDTLKSQVVVPATAVRHGPQGDFVYVLQPDRTVRVRLVKTGPGTGETTSIVSGLNVGEIVITEGGDRLRDGAEVTLPRRHPAGGAAAGGGDYGLYGPGG